MITMRNIDAGNSSELKQLIAVLTSNSIISIVDLVMNHMAGCTNSPYNTFTNYAHSNFPKTAIDFHPSTLGHNDQMAPYHNTIDVGNYSVDVDQLSTNMRTGLKRWGGWLTTNICYSGYRFDLSENIEPWYLKEWMDYPQMRGRFAFLEYWQNADGQEMEAWLELTGHRAAIYDWYLQEIFKEMCESTNGTFDMTRLVSPGLLGIDPSHTVVWVENHDTFRPFLGLSPKYGISTNKEMAYAYALHSQGLPLVYYHDYFRKPYCYHDSSVTNLTGTAMSNTIGRLIKIRKKTVAGGCSVLYTNTDLYIQQRDGGGTKPGSILVLNDHPTQTLNNQVHTMYTNQWLIDLVTTNTNTLVWANYLGNANLSAPPRWYRVYGLTNSLD